MPDCQEQIYSNDYFDFIIAREFLEDLPEMEFCMQQLSEDYESVHYQRFENGVELQMKDVSYRVIPRCFGLLNNEALGNSGILKVRDQPNLALTGRGVLVGFIDTDFDYTNPLFCNPDGTTRVMRIWNQEDRNGIPPKGFLYGSEYTREQINEELLVDHDSMTAKIPFADGHGTFLAALAAGSEDFGNQFSGAAPECDIAFVQLKPAKQYLKDFYFIPDETPVFQENDIMAGLRYLNMLATELRKPLSVCIALGTNMGNRGGLSPIASALNEISRRRQRCVTIACGNEADKRHHFQGGIPGQNGEERVEISVSDGVDGFIAEVWAEAPELYQVTVVSPTGERFRALPSAPGSHTEYQFLFEGTSVTVDYLLTGAVNTNELIYIRFQKPIPGIWVLNVSVRNFANGIYHIWLPMTDMISGDAVFIRSNPDTTITVPSDAEIPITVAGYNGLDGSIYFESGRGFAATNDIKPDIAAPAVDVYGPVGEGKFETRSGTSVASAIAAGAGALMLEWTGVRRNDIGATTANIKTYFIRGAVRDDSKSYPNREWGWGQLDLYKTFENFRNV